VHGGTDDATDEIRQVISDSIRLTIVLATEGSGAESSTPSRPPSAGTNLVLVQRALLLLAGCLPRVDGSWRETSA